MFEDDLGGIADAMAAMEEIPPYILEPLNAAYMKGAVFVMHVRVFIFDDSVCDGEYVAQA